MKNTDSVQFLSLFASTSQEHDKNVMGTHTLLFLFNIVRNSLVKIIRNVCLLLYYNSTKPHNPALRGLWKQVQITKSLSDCGAKPWKLMVFDDEFIFMETSLWLWRHTGFFVYKGLTQFYSTNFEGSSSAYTSISTRWQLWQHISKDEKTGYYYHGLFTGLLLTRIYKTYRVCSNLPEQMARIIRLWSRMFSGVRKAAANKSRHICIVQKPTWRFQTKAALSPVIPAERYNNSCPPFCDHKSPGNVAAMAVKEKNIARLKPCNLTQLKAEQK